MSHQEPRVGEQRPGGRAARVRTSVLDATARLLTEVGYDRVSVEEVAARAGVHKTTVYRRWPTKAELVTDAARVHSSDAVPVPDTGTLLADLSTFARAVAANIGSDAGARRSRSVVAAAATSDDLASNMHEFWAERFAVSASIVERAIERGEVAPDTDPTLVIEALVGPIWLRLLLTGEPITSDLADRLAALVGAGVMIRPESAGGEAD